MSGLLLEIATWRSVSPFWSTESTAFHVCSLCSSTCLISSMDPSWTNCARINEPTKMILMPLSMKTCFFFVVNQSLGTDSNMEEGSFTVAPGTTTLWMRKESSECGNECGRVDPCGRL